jgi:hypothetical protein
MLVWRVFLREQKRFSKMGSGQVNDEADNPDTRQ